MNHEDSRQRGMALIEALFAALIFAISLIALLNYYQFIALNFHHIWNRTQALRVLNQSLELRAAGIYDITSFISQQNAQWKIIAHSVEQSVNCEQVTMILVVTANEYSSERWFCSLENINVSNLSF